MPTSDTSKSTSAFEMDLEEPMEISDEAKELSKGSSYSIPARKTTSSEQGSYCNKLSSSNSTDEGLYRLYFILARSV